MDAQSGNILAKRYGPLYMPFDRDVADILRFLAECQMNHEVMGLSPIPVDKYVDSFVDSHWQVLFFKGYCQIG